MYSYLLAPALFVAALLLGWGPRSVPPRAFAWLAAAILAMAAGEYFTGFFPAINIRFGIYLALFVLSLRLVRLVLSRSANTLLHHRRLAYSVIAIAAFLILSIFSFGGVLALAATAWLLVQSARRRPGPRPVNRPGGFAGNLDAMRRAVERLGPFAVFTLGSAAAAFAAAVVLNAVTNLAAAATYAPQVALVGARTTASLPPIQAGDIPIVEGTNAAIVLSNAIGGLGPQYHVSQRGLSLVRYHGKLVWTSPLEFNNGVIWATTGHSPGYILTSASNPNAKPDLVTGLSVKITPSAGLWDNLARILYQHFPTLFIGTSDWELSPSGKPYWVTSLYAPAPGLSSLVTRVIVGCALTDPQTGQVRYYPLGKQPAWVSQVVGPNFAQSEALRYGWDRAGFLASTFTHRLTTRPVHNTPYNVLLGNGGLGWEIPMTSPNSADNSLAGILLVDAETNQVTYTPFTGVQNDIAVAQRINGATINSTLSAGRALLYNLSGSLAYVAPVVNQSGIVQQVAIADPRNTVQPIIASSLGEALASWQSYLVGNGGQTLSLKRVTGTVQRVATVLSPGGASGATVKEYWLFRIDGVAYRASLSLNPNVVPFVRPGDAVTVSFLTGGAAPITLQSIVDHTLEAPRRP